MSLVECPAKQDGAEIVPCINSLIEKTPFDVIAYTFDWHPEDHCSFIENVNKRKIAKYSPVNIRKIGIFKIYFNKIDFSRPKKTSKSMIL